MVQWECTGNGQFGNQRKSCSKEKLLALLVFNLISVRIFSSSCPNFATDRYNFIQSFLAKDTLKEVIVKNIGKLVANLIWVGC